MAEPRHFVIFKARELGDQEVAIDPRKVSGLEVGVNPERVVIYYPRPGARTVTVAGSIRGVLRQLGIEYTDAGEEA